MVFRLAVKTFGGFTATCAKIRLGSYRLRLGSLAAGQMARRQRQCAAIETSKVSPWGRRDDMPPPRRRRQFDGGKNRGGSMSVRGRVRRSLVAGGGLAAGSQRAYSLGSCAMGQTDGQTDGRIALFQNAP